MPDPLQLLQKGPVPLPSPLLPGMFIYFLRGWRRQGEIGKRRGMNKVREAGRVRGTAAAIINHLPWQRASCESASVILIKASGGMAVT